MGSGKSTLGRQFAELAFFSGAQFVDLDALIVSEQGKSIPQIFKDEGESAFRAIESACLAQALASKQGKIIATGGGAVLSADNRALMQQQSSIVWLDATPEVLAKRIAGDGNRPLLDGVDPLVKMKALTAQRNPLYAEIADLRVDTGMYNTQQAVASILEFMAE